MRRSRGIALSLYFVLPLFIACAGCTSKEKVAREDFARTRGCPLGEVTATEHPELSAYVLMYGVLEPPADIASEPARVAMWRAENDRKKRDTDATTTVFLAKGCKKKQHFGCSRSNPKQGSNVHCTPIGAAVP